MLAVVVLLPIAIMIIACLLERFESTALPAARSARRSRSVLRRAPHAPQAPHLALVPDADPMPDAAPAPHAVPAAVVGLDADTMDLRRAS